MLLGLQLDQNKKDQCLIEIERRLPELMRKANLSLSHESISELTEIVKSSVEFEYFPTEADILTKKVALGIVAITLSPVLIAFLPFSLLFYPALISNLPLIIIPENCRNRELVGLSRKQLDIFEDIIMSHILLNYQDFESQARIKQEAEEKMRCVDEQKRVCADIEKMRQQKEFERIQTRIDQLKPKFVPSRKIHARPFVTSEPVAVAYSFKTARFLTLAAIAEDHDGNPVKERGCKNNLSL